MDARVESSADGAFYIETITLAERLHRRLLDLIRAELDRRGFISVNAAQALMLHGIGDEAVSPKTILDRGFYAGLNPTYNLDRLEEDGFVLRERQRADKRRVLLTLTEQGKEIRDLLVALFRRQSRAMEKLGTTGICEVTGVNAAMKRLDYYLAGVIA